MTTPKRRENPWNFDFDRNAEHVAEVTERARPHPARKHAPLKDRLTRPGTMPYVIPEPVIATLALMQGQLVEMARALKKENQGSPILWSGIVQLDAAGVYTRGWQLQYHCVSIANLTNALVTIAPGGEGDPGRVPTVGAGVHQIPAGNSGLFAVMGNAIAIYGAAGGLVDLAVATEWVPGL